MRITGGPSASVVQAAQAGAAGALDTLVAESLPLVYTLVRRGIGAHADVDDVVQEVMLRALRELRALRSPESYRPWLMAIAVRQISTHLSRARSAAERMAPLDDDTWLPDQEVDIEDLSIARVELSTQRRVALHAAQWLDPADRALLSLWWLEVGGSVSRAEVAAALGVSVPHAGVRIQRMRTQLDLCRAVVAALAAQPRCAKLDVAVEGWDGVPRSVWRKRIARHLRGCAECGETSVGLLPLERLIIPLALLPVPFALTTALIGKSVLGGGAAGAAAASSAVGSAKLGLLGQLSQAAAAHPVVTTAAAGAIAAGATVTATQLPLADSPSRPAIAASPTTTTATTRAASPAPRRDPGATASPTDRPPAASPTGIPTTSPVAPAAEQIAEPVAAAAGTLQLGQLVLESAARPGSFVVAEGELSFLAHAPRPDEPAVAKKGTFRVVPGLNDPECFSLQTPDGRYVRHQDWRLKLHWDDGSELFRGDATYCPIPGPQQGSILLESSNYPGWFIHPRNNEMWVDFLWAPELPTEEDRAAFLAASAFLAHRMGG